MRARFAALNAMSMPSGYDVAIAVVSLWFDSITPVSSMRQACPLLMWLTKCAARSPCQVMSAAPAPLPAMFLASLATAYPVADWCQAKPFAVALPSTGRPLGRAAGRERLGQDG